LINNPTIGTAAQINESTYKLMDTFRNAVSTGMFSSFLKEATVAFKATNLTTISVSRTVVFGSIQLIITTFAPTISPTTTSNMDTSISNKNKSILPIVVIAGVGGGVLVLCIALCLGYYLYYQRGSDDDDSKGNVRSNQNSKRKSGAADNDDEILVQENHWNALEDLNNDENGSHDVMDPFKLRIHFYENPKFHNSKIVPIN